MIGRESRNRAPAMFPLSRSILFLEAFSSTYISLFVNPQKLTYVLLSVNAYCTPAQNPGQSFFSRRRIPCMRGSRIRAWDLHENVPRRMPERTFCSCPVVGGSAFHYTPPLAPRQNTVLHYTRTTPRGTKLIKNHKYA